MSRNKGTFNFAANFEVLAKAPLDAKQLVGTYADLTLAVTWEDGDGGIWLYDGAIVSVSSDPTPEKNGIYYLSDAANYNLTTSWIHGGGGSGTITGGTNGLSTAGKNVVLGGGLTGNTSIELDSNEFQITTTGATPTFIGIDQTGIILSYSGTSGTTVLLEGNSGLEYARDYSINYNSRSLVDVDYVTGHTADNYLKLNQTTPQNVTGSQPVFNEGIELGITPTASQISGHTKGRIYYDEEYETVSVDIGDESTLQVGQEMLRYVYNSSSSVTIPNGSVVNFIGVHSGSGVDTVSVGLAIATGNTSQIIGVATQSISPNGFGFVTLFGNVNNLDTVNGQYSGIAVADKLYLSAVNAGEVTNVPPTSPDSEIFIGGLVTKDATNGKLFVRIVPISSLNSLRDVSTPSPILDNVLTWNGLKWIDAPSSTSSASAGVSFYNATPVIFSRTMPAGISEDGSSGNGVEVATLSKIPVVSGGTVYVSGSSDAGETRAFIAFDYPIPLGKTSIDAGTWSFYSFASVDSVGGGSITTATRQIYQVSPLSGGTLTTVTGGTNDAVATITSNQFTGTYFSASTTNTGATWLKTSTGIYQISGKTDNNNVTIIVPTGYSGETAISGATIWNRLFGITTPTLTTALTLYEGSIVQGAFPIDVNDRLGQIGFVTTDTGTRTIIATYNGTTHASYFNSPLVTLHNDLAGLQGGSSTERYHITQAEAIVVGNTSGTNTGDDTGLISTHWHDYSVITNTPDLSVYQSISGFTGYTATTQPIVDAAFTGATNVGSGEDVYRTGTSKNDLYFKTIVGSGTTAVNVSGDTIVVSSQGGGVFSDDIIVSIEAGKTFGRYENGDTIPASGKTANEVILLSLVEPIDPTVTLTSSGNDVAFGQSSKTVYLDFTYTINTLNASVATVLLEWRRGNTGSWVSLTTSTGATDYTHSINDSANRFNTGVLNYRYTVVDTQGATGVITYNVTPQAYAAPTISPNYAADSVHSYESQTLRELGNVNTTVTGSISSNRTHVDITGYTIQRSINGGAYTIIETVTGLNTQSATITSYLDSSSTSNATSIRYRITANDDYTASNGSVYTITLRYSSYFGYNTNSTLSSAQIIALGNQALLTSRVRTVDPVTAPASNYTYVSYPASFGDLTSIIMDGASPVLGAFTKLTNVTVTNGYGEAISNIIYKSNAVAAFTNNELAFT